MSAEYFVHAFLGQANILKEKRELLQFLFGRKLITW
jgi:hypothetical protein